MSETSNSSARARKRAPAAAALVLAAAAAVVVTIVLQSGKSGSHAPERSTASDSTTVARRNLVNSLTEEGTITYAGTQTVDDQLSGTVTWTPSIGQVIQPGQKLYAVDNYPVLLMDGTTPAYRTLRSGDSPGPDIAQLNADLVTLGYDAGGIVENDEWQPATTTGVKALQAEYGLTQTGSLSLGTIVFMHGAVRISSLTITDSSDTSYDPIPAPTADFVSSTSGSSPSSQSSGSEAATTTPTGTTAQNTPRPGHKDCSSSTANAEISTLEQLVKTLQQQNRELEQQRSTGGTSPDKASSGDKGSSHKSASSHKHSGSKREESSGVPAAGAGSSLMTTTSTQLVVSASVPAGQQSITRVGQKVPVEMPDGKTVYGHVKKIGGVSSGSGGDSSVPITITLDRRENGRNLDQAAVSVKFVTNAARNVLSVPVTALVAQPGGHFAVQEAEAPHALIPVTIGIFATGYVQISGRGIRPGLKVTESQG